MPTVLPRTVRVLLSAAFVLLLFGPAEARAQLVATSFAELKTLVKPGDTLEITDTKGRRTTGRLGDLSASSLELLVWTTDYLGDRAVPQTVVEADVRRIRVARSDSLWNGTLIGLGVGAGLGGFASSVSCADYGCHQVAGTLAVGGIGAAIGLAIDAGRKKQIDVYQRAPGQRVSSVRVLPMLSKSAAGIGMAMKF